MILDCPSIYVWYIDRRGRQHCGTIAYNHCHWKKLIVRSFVRFVRLPNYVTIFSFADPRTNNWPLISSPWPTLSILAAYLYFVRSWGPRYMANRKPYKLENVLLVYNFVQVIVSVFIFYEVWFGHRSQFWAHRVIDKLDFCFDLWQGMEGAWLRHYSWRCQPVNTSTGPEGMRVSISPLFWLNCFEIR